MNNPEFINSKTHKYIERRFKKLLTEIDEFDKNRTIFLEKHKKEHRELKRKIEEQRTPKESETQQEKETREDVAIKIDEQMSALDIDRAFSLLETEELFIKRRVIVLKKRVQKIKKQSLISSILLDLKEDGEETSDKIYQAINDFKQEEQKFVPTILEDRSSLFEITKKDLLDLTDKELSAIQEEMGSHIEKLKSAHTNVKIEITNLEERFTEALNSNPTITKELKAGFQSIREKLIKKLAEIENHITKVDNSHVINKDHLKYRKEQLDKQFEELKATLLKSVAALKSTRKIKTLSSLNQPGSLFNPKDEDLLNLDLDSFFKRTGAILKSETKQAEEELKKAIAFKKELNRMHRLLNSEENKKRRSKIENYLKNIVLEYEETLSWFSEIESLAEERSTEKYWEERRKKALELKNKVEDFSAKAQETGTLLEEYKKEINPKILNNMVAHLSVITKLIERIEEFKKDNPRFSTITITNQLKELRQQEEDLRTIIKEINAPKQSKLLRPTSSVEKKHRLTIEAKDYTPPIEHTSTTVEELIKGIEISLENQETISLEEGLRDGKIRKLKAAPKSDDWRIEKGLILSEIQYQIDDLKKLSDEIKAFKQKYPDQYSKEIKVLEERLKNRLSPLKKELLEIEKFEPKHPEPRKKKSPQKSFLGLLTGTLIGITIPFALFAGIFPPLGIIAIPIVIATGAITALLGMAIGFTIDRIIDKVIAKKNKNKKNIPSPSKIEKRSTMMVLGHHKLKPHLKEEHSSINSKTPSDNEKEITASVEENTKHIKHIHDTRII